MARNRKNRLRARVSGNTAFVSTTDVRQNFTAIHEKVLGKYDAVVVEKNGRPVAVIKRPSEGEVGVRVEEF
jgi:hypothetical protein